MTTSQIQFAPHFRAPVTEDPMELTSDVDQRAGADDDIDIDLDLTGDNPHDREDEFMGEEDMNALADSTSVDGQELHAAHDDEMADDSYAQGQFDAESSLRDEDIVDAEYTGPEPDEDTIIEPDIDDQNEESEELLAIYQEIVAEQNHEQDYQKQEYNEQENHEQSTTPETEPDFAEIALPNEGMGLSDSNHTATEVATGETSDEYAVGVGQAGTTNHSGTDQSSERSDLEVFIAPEAMLEPVGEEVLPTSIDQEIVAQSHVEGSHSQEEDPLDSAAHLHPIVLDYQGDEMFLFPPVDQTGEHAATFLLSDEQLAYSTIGNLLEACRGILKGSLSEQDELTINIDDLDLHISESTIECASTRLSEVVDVYVRLQQNDGLENPPPLYMDLTSRNRFSHRLDVLRNALIEGKGLSQLKPPQENEYNQQHMTEGETEPPNHTASLSSNETDAPEQQPREETVARVDQYDSHSDPLLLPENTLLRTGSAAQGILSYPIADAAHEENDRADPQIDSDKSLYEAGFSDVLSSEALGSRESFGPSKPFASESESQKAEESIAEDGDFIDYKDVEELEGGTSSASSTLQGDAIDVNGVQDHAVPEEPILAEYQEQRSPHNVQENPAVDEDIVDDFVDEEHSSDVGMPVEEEHSNLADILSHDSNEKGQSLSGNVNEGEAPEIHQHPSISPETDLQPNANARDNQHGASSQYEDNPGSYRYDTSHEHADQTEGDGYPVADTKFNGNIEEYSSTHLYQSESSGSGRSYRELKDLEIENELEEADRSLNNDDNEKVPRPLEVVNTRPSFVPDESAQTQDDDDEITYEDEEDDTDSLHEPAKTEHNLATSPGSLKRARSLDEDALEEDLQGAKRVRSG